MTAPVEAMLVSGAGGCGRDGHRLVSAPSSDRSGGVPAPYARARRGAGAVERGGLENRCPPCGGPRVRIPPSPPPSLSLPRVLRLGPKNGGFRAVSRSIQTRERALHPE